MGGSLRATAPHGCARPSQSNKVEEVEDPRVGAPPSVTLSPSHDPCSRIVLMRVAWAHVLQACRHGRRSRPLRLRAEDRMHLLPRRADPERGRRLLGPRKPPAHPTRPPPRMPPLQEEGSEGDGAGPGLAIRGAEQSAAGVKRRRSIAKRPPSSGRRVGESRTRSTSSGFTPRDAAADSIRTKPSAPAPHNEKGRRREAPPLRRLPA